MIDKYRDKLDEEGVSPVIGVILLVAVTVALVALATVIVFDIGSDVSDTADATVDIQETSTGISVDVIRNENIDELRVVSPDGSSQTFDSDVGSSHTIGDGGGSYSIVATLGDGSEETIRTITSSADSSVLSGTVSYNSPVEGVLVESYDSEGNLLVDSDLTNANGVYNVKEADELRVNGFTASYGDVDLNTVASNEGTSVPSILMNGDGSSSSPYEISTASDLQAMQEDLSANYIVVNDIDASGTVNWNNGQGFDPVGTYDDEQANSEFTGSFDGQNHTISNLSINRLDDYGFGLFGAIGAGGEVKNVGVINVNITGEREVGGLAGINYGEISNSNTDGAITGESFVGGLVGSNSNGTVSNSYSTGNVTGELRYVGGLVGKNYNSTVSNSYWNSDSKITENSKDVSTEDSTDLSTDNTKSAVPLTTSQMQGCSASSSMSGFDFTDTWSTVEGDYPELQWQEYRADVKFFIVLLWYTVMCFLISGIILMGKRR